MGAGAQGTISLEESMVETQEQKPVETPKCQLTVTAIQKPKVRTNIKAGPASANC